jgi:hypothetical protein
MTAKQELMIRDDHYVDPDSNLAKQERLLLEAMTSWGESFYKMGVVLTAIRDSRTWEKDAGYTNFDQYCDDRQPQGLKRTQVKSLIAASKIRPLLPTFEGNGNAANGGVWTERNVRPLTHSDFKPGDVRRLCKKIATHVKRGERLTASLVKSICDEDRGVVRQTQERKAKQFAKADSPSQVLHKLKVDVELWQLSLAELPADFWVDAESEDAGCLKRAISAVSELASFLRS